MALLTGSNTPIPLENLSQSAIDYVQLNKDFSNSPILNGLLRNAVEIDRLYGIRPEDFGDTDKALVPVLRHNLNCLHRICDDWLNTGHYSTLPDRYRLIYAFCSAVRAKFCFQLGEYFEALRHCDEGLLKGNDLEDEALSKFATMLCRDHLPAPPDVPEDIDQREIEQVVVPKALPNSRQIASLELPSLETFYRDFYRPELPLIITGMVSGWAAFEKWSFSYLNSICGHRLVPVELGSKYTDEDWSQQLMSFNQYMAKYVFPKTKPSEPGYMAQHRLLDQIPELVADVPIPDYCVFGDDQQEGGPDDRELTINAFIGPAGTVSPLHTDPRHNLFCQVRGRKFVRLISPRDKAGLYLYDDLMRRNTSQVNVEQPDLDQFPQFANVKCHDFTVEAGQCLFIPRGWFHHVRALEPSISISIWFGPSSRQSTDDHDHDQSTNPS